MSTTYLPVYTLSQSSNPTSTDLLVVQSSETNGDVELLTIADLISNFVTPDIEIDSSTTDLYEAMGWVMPT